jgi:hypothetical protein
MAWLTTIGLFVYVLSSTAFSPPWPVRPFEPIPCSSSCGWNYYYVIVIGLLQLLAIAGIAITSMAAAALLRSVQAWLDKPAGSDCDNVTNGDQIRRRWRISRRERALMRSLTARYAGSAPAGNGGAIERYREVLPTSAWTAFRLDPAPDCMDDVAGVLADDPLIESLDVSDQGDAVVLCGHWDLTRLDYLPMRRWSRAAHVPSGRVCRLLRAITGGSSPREHEVTQ